MERRLASGMPWDAETSRLLDQTPSNPARSTSFAPRPLWAPTIRTRPGRVNSSLNFFALDIPLSHEGVIQEKEKGWSGPVSRILSSPRGEGWSFLWVPHCCRTLAAYPRAPGGPPFSPVLRTERPPGPLQPGTNIAAFAPPGKEGILSWIAAGEQLGT